MQKNVFIVDNRYMDAVRAAFGSFGHFVPSVRCPELPEPEACHPDMAVFAAGGTVICAPSVYAAYCRLLSPFGINLVQGQTAIGRDYPKSVAYNVLCAGGYAFAHWAVTEPQIMKTIERCGMIRQEVAQGYARCSALAFGENLITADPSIAQAAHRCGLSVLKLTPGHILLPGYEYGFIGGASGLLDAHTIGFFGDLSLHPEGERIRRFIRERGFAICEVSGRPLTDVGTVLRITAD